MSTIDTRSQNLHSLMGTYRFDKPEWYFGQHIKTNKSKIGEFFNMAGSRVLCSLYMERKG